MKTLILLLGERKNYITQAEGLLTNILERYSVLHENFQYRWCYYHAPASRKEDREQERLQRRNSIMGTVDPAHHIVIGFGWAACDLLFFVGKSKMHTRLGCKWPIIGYEPWKAWFTNDPAAALFDPAITVDIAGVIATAMKDAGQLPSVNPNVKPFKWTSKTLSSL